MKTLESTEVVGIPVKLMAWALYLLLCTFSWGQRSPSSVSFQIFHSCFPSPIYHSLAPCFFCSAVSCHSRLLSQLPHVLSVGLLPGSQCWRKTGKEIGLEGIACVLASESRLYTWMFFPLAPMRHSLPSQGSWRPLQEFSGLREWAVVWVVGLVGVPAWGMRHVACRSSLCGCLSVVSVGLRCASPSCSLRGCPGCLSP